MFFARKFNIGAFLCIPLLGACAFPGQYFGIDAENSGSIALHQKLGFVHSGTITQAGFKFGRWLDLACYQLTLATPLQPHDD